MARIVIIGGHGDGPVVAEVIRTIASRDGSVAVHGFLNDVLPLGAMIAGAPVLGAFEDWHRLPDDIRFIPVVHKVGQMRQRVARLQGLGIAPERLATVIHPLACIAADVEIGAGCFIASHVTVQPGARLGASVSIRAGANVGHDAQLGDFTYMGANATLCGRARLEEGAHLGPNAAVLEDRIVGSYAVVGLCSAVLRNVPDGEVVLGNPARPLASLAKDRI